jgi:hypothetical protein
MSIWEYNPITGYWKYVRSVTDKTADEWLKIFQSDEPGKKFRVSKRKPK